ncbi:gag-Pol polyprotein [Trichonephila clavipes]|nr:gag-Pol polyprotein [Trichonephila clavipes]
MDKKFEEMEGRIESVEYKFENKFVDIENKFENKFEDMESKLEAKIFEKVEDVSISFRSDLEKLKQKWDSQTKACQLVASLRADAADILQTLPETQRLDFDALVNALELRFGEKCVKGYSRLQLKSRQQKVSETLQELATDVERLSQLAFSECPTEVREVLALQHFIDGVRDPEIRKLSNGGSQGLKGGPSVCYEIRGSPASNTKGQTPHTSRQRIGHVELKCGAVRATDEKFHE